MPTLELDVFCDTCKEKLVATLKVNEILGTIVVDVEPCDECLAEACINGEDKFSDDLRVD